MMASIERDRPTLGALAAAFALAAVACGADADDESAPADGDAAAAERQAAGGEPPPACDDLVAVPPDSMEATDSGLRILRADEGAGRSAEPGDTVAVHYVGCLTDGTKFDASYDRDAPIEFALGTGRVIAGWDEGLAGMKPGGVRVLRIPPELGYGPRGTPDGPIPPDATLIFHVRLVDVEPGDGAEAG